MILSPEAMYTVEKRAFASGAKPEALMDEAGGLMTEVVRQFCKRPGTCLAFFGKGHNGGDALVVGRHLTQMGWKVVLIPAFPETDWAPLTTLKHRQAGLCETWSGAELERWRPTPGEPLIVLDGLLGIGATGNLKKPILSQCRYINKLRACTSAQVFALDVPTGLNGSTGEAQPDTIIADVTLTVGFAKSGLLADGAERWVGRLALLPLEALTTQVDEIAPLEIATPATLAPVWKRRTADMHKGDCGRVTLVAGARGTIGAAALAARGALRAGAGLVTLCVPESIYALAATMVPAECMVLPVRDLREALALRADALGIGPGLGVEHPESTLEVIGAFRGPAVIDADALNVLAAGRMDALLRCAGPRLCTPHPGEMARMDPAGIGLARRVCVERATLRWPVTLLLKGARTLVGTQGRALTYNTTGNPGMASGGMGDVLTGVCAALLAQGLGCHEAAVLGAWLCGRAAEALVTEGSRSQESLLASDVADALGTAFNALRERGH